MNAHDGTIGIERFDGTHDVGRNDKAFIAAPGKAKTEMLKPVHEYGQRGPRHGMEDNAEQTAGTLEVPLPDRVTRIILKRGMKNPRHFRFLLQPAREP